MHIYLALTLTEVGGTYISWPHGVIMTIHVVADIKINKSPFLFLAVDLPPPPLFQDSIEKNIIPQVALATVLAKYDGKTTQVCFSAHVYYTRD